MIRKVFLVLMTSSLFLFFSCGSTKPQAADETELEPPVETEEIQEQAEQEKEEQESSAENESTSETETNTENEETEQDAQEDEDINSLYPPLEEIEEPDLIELEPVEQTQVVDEQEEEKNQITEPVEEVEELPPLPQGENVETEEGLEGAEGAETEEGLEPAEGTEGTESDESVEPTIEIEPEEEEPEPEIVIVPSRSVTLKKGETLVITYPGNGWIYMGSTSEYNNLASRGRKLGTTDTKYTLFAKESGTQIHHFYKVDNLTGDYIDDYIEVTVLEKKGKSSTVVNAPDYSEVVPKKPETPAKAKPKPEPKKEVEETPAETEKPAAPATAEKTAPATDTTYKAKETQTKPKTQEAPKPVSEPEQTQEAAEEEDSVIEIDTEDAVIVIDEDNENAAELEPLIESARTQVSSKKYDDAYPALIQYLELSTDNRDEALFLLGQILESNSKYRDIKQAVETYQTLCDNYPASKYWDKANKRIVYLKRFYINIH